MPIDARIPLLGRPVQGIDVEGMRQRSLVTSEMEANAQDRVVKARADAAAEKQSAQVYQLLKDSLYEDEDGLVTYDRNKLMHGFGGAIPDGVSAMLEESDKVAKSFQEAQTAAVRQSAANVKMLGHSPEVFISELERLERMGIVRGRHVRPIIDYLRKNPDGIAALTESLIHGPTKPNYTNVAPGTSVIDINNPQGGAVFTGPAAPANPPTGFTLPANTFRYEPDPANPGTFIRVASGPPPTDRNQQSSGVPTVKDQSEMVAAIIKNPKLFERLTPTDARSLIPALSAAGFDFEKALLSDAKNGPNVGAIISKIEELSQKINTSSGGLKSVAQGVQRGAFASMQMDNEASLYESLVIGMIPMVARAVGHSGVLTQQDVESVRALFPRLGDNAALAKGKLDTVKGLLGGKKLTAEELIKKYTGGGG